MIVLGVIYCRYPSSEAIIWCLQICFLTATSVAHLRLLEAAIVHRLCCYFEGREKLGTTFNIIKR